MSEKQLKALTGTKTKRSSPEDDLQAECFRVFRYMHRPLEMRFYAIPNGGKRNVIVAAKMKKTGTLSGAWDTFLSVPRGGKGGLYIEFKAGKNGLTDNQIAFKKANEHDYAWAVCYTVDEFIRAVSNYLSLK